MRKLFYLGFCLVLTMGVGCVLGNYELITDNDQTRNGGAGPVNTNGKAHIRESSQIATIWPDGTDESIWFVDQKANGDRVLTNYNNFSTGGDPTFHDDFYCNPDWNGCSMTTSQDPEVGDVSIFDYTGNPNCLGYRSLYYILSTTRYYGECGRGVRSLADRLSFLNMGAPTTFGGVEALRWSLTPMNTSIFVDNLAGAKINVPLTGVVNLTINGAGTRKGAIDMTSPSIRATFDAMANFYQNYGSGVNQVEIVYNGLTFTKQFATFPDPAKHVRDRINTRY